MSDSSNNYGLRDNPTGAGTSRFPIDRSVADDQAGVQDGQSRRRQRTGRSQAQPDTKKATRTSEPQDQTHNPRQRRKRRNAPFVATPIAIVDRPVSDTLPSRWASADSPRPRSMGNVIVAPEFNRPNSVAQFPRTNSSVHDTSRSDWSRGASSWRSSYSRRTTSDTVDFGPVKAVADATPPSQRPTRSRRAPSALLYLVRLLISGVGIGVIAGTLLSTLDPSSYSPTTATQPITYPRALRELGGNRSSNAPAPINLKPDQEIVPLKTELQALITQGQGSGLTAELLLLDLDSNAYVDLDSSTPLPAASTIKLPILVAFFQDVDAGKIHLDERLTLQAQFMATGSGDLQNQPVGTQYTALDVITKMMAISDNTATNMIVARLGGPAALNQRFQLWKLNATLIRNVLPDLNGTNTTSPRDLATLMTWVTQGELVSVQSRDRILDIMRQTVTRTLLPSGLGEGATIAHKTGDIGSLLGDVGLIDLPNGKRYVVAVLVKRPFNDNRARDLITKISRTTYTYFNKPPAVPAFNGQIEGMR